MALNFAPSFHDITADDQMTIDQCFIYAFARWHDKTRRSSL